MPFHSNVKRLFFSKKLALFKIKSTEQRKKVMDGILHTKTKFDLEASLEHLKLIKYQGDYCPKLPGKAKITLGKRTPARYYEEYDWHESIISGKQKNSRKIYSTSNEHSLINVRAEGFSWANNELNDGYIEGIHLKGEKVEAIHLVDNTGRSHYCIEFKIYRSEERIESDHWWKKKEPFWKGQDIYFLGYGLNRPEPATVEECKFHEELDFCGCWRVKAYLGNRDKKVSAGSWMFSTLPNEKNERGECFQVNQWYSDDLEKIGFLRGSSSGNNPCYNNEKEARDFLEEASFPGDITRIITINGLSTGWTNGVVHRKTEGEKNFQVAREQSSEVIKKAKASKNLVRPLQRKSNILSENGLDYFS
jgi:hypothetical protein